MSTTFNNGLLMFPRVSDMEIDVDKDLEALGITNLREIAAGMTKGDIVFFDGTRIVKISPGAISMMFTTQGLGADPVWA